MKYVDEFRRKDLILKAAGLIKKAVARGRTYTFMEVCGTHTMSIFRFALKNVLPESIKLISGPGCPVCVTPNEFLDKAIAISRLKNIIITTFGDMMRVPGSYSSLEAERAKDSDIRIVYSSLDALELARKYPDKEIVFLGVGFETTAPTVGQSILMARKEGIKNYSVLSANKTMPEALEMLAKDKDMNVDGFMLPGHVSAVIGARPYKFLARAYRKRCVITGFEPVDILEGILMLVKQDIPKVDVQYARVISASGNILAKHSIERVFNKTDAVWRGIGLVEDSGLCIKKEFSEYDAERKFRPRINKARENKLCICGEVLKGKKTPPECKLFGKVCNQDNPVGACMVSSEGACAAYYKYNFTSGKNNG